MDNEERKSKEKGKATTLHRQRKPPPTVNMEKKPLWYRAVALQS
jgi:hypothetical protein